MKYIEKNGNEYKIDEIEWDTNEDGTKNYTITTTCGKTIKFNNCYFMDYDFGAKVDEKYYKELNIKYIKGKVK